MSDGHIPFDDSDASVYRVLGPPGTGKTTYLVDQAERAAQKYGSDNVRVVSMTQTASKAFMKKKSIIPAENVSTLHALAYRAIGRPGVIGKDEVEKWNAAYPGYALSGVFDPIDGPVSKTFGDALMMDVELARAKRVQPGYAAARDFAQLYEQFKAEIGKVDFTGMLELALEEIDFAPGRPEVLLVDEAQDLSTLELQLVEKWASRCKALVLCGDSDQCQPAGTVVNTTSGPVLIENLNPAAHRVVGWNKREGAVIYGRGSAFKIGSRPYVGKMFSMSSNGHTTRSTANHKWSVRLRPADGLYCTYLMKKGSWWRVGQCKLTRTPGTHPDRLFSKPLGVKFRANVEGAEAVWILKVFDNIADALTEEAIVAASYGIPQTCFTCDNHMKMSMEHISRVFDASKPRIEECLSVYGKMLEFPLFTRDRAVVESCNLIPECMEVPVWSGEGKSYSWMPFSIESNDFNGDVYSLDVENGGHYVVEGGIITHNSLYSWRGADPRVLLVEGKKPFNIRDQSYRVPRLVQAHAMEIIRRSGTWSRAEYAPKRENGDKGNVVEGEMSRIPSYFDTPSTVLDDVEVEVVTNPLVEDAMILAQCGYMLYPMAAELKARGIGYHNPYRNEWNPLARGGAKKVTGADKVIAFARLSTPRDWRIALSCLSSERSGGPLIHGAKNRIELLSDDSTMADVVAMLPKVLLEGAYELFEHGGSGIEVSKATMAKFLAACTSVAKESMRFAESVYQRDGLKGVEFPKVILGTIHSTKGGEAEHVYMSAELSPQSRKQKDISGWDGADSIWRTFYVGATRAKHRLVICGDFSPRGAGI